MKHSHVHTAPHKHPMGWCTIYERRCIPQRRRKRESVTRRKWPMKLFEPLGDVFHSSTHTHIILIHIKLNKFTFHYFIEFSLPAAFFAVFLLFFKRNLLYVGAPFGFLVALFVLVFIAMSVVDNWNEKRLSCCFLFYGTLSRYLSFSLFRHNLLLLCLSLHSLAFLGRRALFLGITRGP